MKKSARYKVCLFATTLILFLATNAFSQDMFEPAVNYAVGHFPYSVYAADLDGDGDDDLAVANYESDNVSILLNTTQSCCVQRGDINHNGTGPDIADLVYLVNYMFNGGPDLQCK